MNPDFERSRRESEVINPKPGFINLRVTAFIKGEISQRVTTEIETPFTYKEAVDTVANKLNLDPSKILRIAFN